MQNKIGKINKLRIFGAYFLLLSKFDVKFSVIGDVAAKIIIPCLVVLNIPIFSTVRHYSLPKTLQRKLKLNLNIPDRLK